MATESARLFVGGISQATSAETLRAHFSRYGQLNDCEVIRDRITGHGRGFGFVAFADPSSTDKALQQDHIILGRKVEVRRAKPKDEYSNHWQSQRNRTNKDTCNSGCNTPFNKKKIFVGGLPHNLTDEEFDSFFGNYGTIVDAVVIRDKENNRPRGFGFVTFDTEEAVDNVLKKSFHELNNKRVEVKRALPKEINNAYICNYDVHKRGLYCERGPMHGTSNNFCYSEWFGFCYQTFPVVDSYYHYYQGSISYEHPSFYTTCFSCGNFSNGWGSTSRPVFNYYGSWASASRPVLPRSNHASSLETNVAQIQNGGNQNESNDTVNQTENKVVKSQKENDDGKETRGVESHTKNQNGENQKESKVLKSHDNNSRKESRVVGSRKENDYVETHDDYVESHKESTDAENQKEARINAHQSPCRSYINETGEVPMLSIVPFIEPPSLQSKGAENGDDGEL